LINQLNAGLSQKLTLISAPAGFGKTTLVSSWIETLERPVTWLSLDEDDNHQSRFLAYLISAIQMPKIHYPKPFLSPNRNLSHESFLNMDAL